MTSRKKSEAANRLRELEQALAQIQCSVEEFFLLAADGCAVGFSDEIRTSVARRSVRIFRANTHMRGKRHFAAGEYHLPLYVLKYLERVLHKPVSKRREPRENHRHLLPVPAH